jgi:chitodextrinase
MKRILLSAICKIAFLSWTVTGVSSLHAQSGLLAAWEFDGTNGDTTSVVDTVGLGVSAGDAIIASGLAPATYQGGGGLTARQATAVTLSDAVSTDEYISFTLYPDSGQVLTVDTVFIRPISQNDTSAFTLMSSVTGFTVADSLIGLRTTSNGGATLMALPVPGISQIPDSIEFRIYMYGFSSAFQRVGLGLGSTTEYDLLVTGFVAAAPNDTVAPSVPAGLAASNVTDSSAMVSWAASTDNVLTTGYYVYLDGVLIDSTVSPITSITLSGLMPVSSYDVTVSAFDAAGNVSAQSVPLTFLTAQPPSGLLAAWEFEGTNGDTTSVVDTVGLGVSAGDAIIASGLAPATYQGGGGLTAGQATAVTLSDAVSTDEYISFTLYPDAGQVLTVDTVFIRPVSQNDTSTFTLMSSVAGFTVADSLIGLRARSNGNATLMALPVPGLSQVPDSIEFRIYIYGSSNAFLRVGLGLGNTSEYDLLVTGFVEPTPPDTAAPTAPMGLSASNIDFTSFTLDWMASTDNVGVVGYRLYQDGTLIDSTANLTFDLTGLTPSTTYGMQVQAYDSSGNYSLLSDTLDVTTLTPDTDAPTAPMGLSASNIDFTSFTLDWMASTDNVGVVGYRLYQDGTLIDSTANLTVDLTGLTENTTYSMQVQAYDSSGNYSALSSALAVTTLALELMFDGDSLALPNADAGTTTFGVMSNVSWTLSESADWLTLNPMSDSADATVTATFTENTSDSIRYAVIMVSGAGLMDSLVISQLNDTTTGIFTPARQVLMEVYPNPTEQWVQVVAPAHTQRLDIGLYALSGQRLFHQQTRGHEAKLDLSALVPGVYLLRINGEAHRLIKK